MRSHFCLMGVGGGQKGQGLGWFAAEKHWSADERRMKGSIDQSRPRARRSRRRAEIMAYSVKRERETGEGGKDVRVSATAVR